MRTNTKVFIILFALTMLLSGCKTTFLVHNATVAQITPILFDYAGVHGYRINYQNAKTGSYGLDLGSVYQPYNSSTTKSTSVIATPANRATGQPLTAYEETTWNTVAYGGYNVDANANALITQQGTDVLIVLDGNGAGGTSINDLSDYIQQHGYAVEQK